MFQAAAVDDLARDELARRPRRARAREDERARSHAAAAAAMPENSAARCPINQSGRARGPSQIWWRGTRTHVVLRCVWSLGGRPRRAGNKRPPARGVRRTNCYGPRRNHRKIRKCRRVRSGRSCCFVSVSVGDYMLQLASGPHGYFIAINELLVRYTYIIK